VSRQAEEEPVLHTGVAGEPHYADWSSWKPAKANPTLCSPGHEIRSCGVPGCHRHQVRPVKETAA
jgi:hypothetical protein